MSLSVRLNVVTAGVLAAAGLAAVVLVNRNDRALALDIAEERARGLLERSLAIHAFLNRELKPAVFALPGAAQATYDPRWMSSSFAIRRIEELAHEGGLPRIRYKESAIGARHPSREADAVERAFLEAARRDPRVVYRSSVRDVDGAPHLEVLRRGEVVEAACLRCHGRPEDAPPGLVATYGPDRAFGWRPGQLASAISVRVPVSEAFAAANRFSLRLSLALAAVLAVVFVAQVVAQRRLVHVPLERLRREAARVAAGAPAGDGPPPPPEAPELRELTDAFGAMEAEVARRRAELERTVEARTAELLAANRELEQAARDREASEALLRQSQKMEAVGRLAGGVAHDFNNLLTVISGATAELEEGLGRGEPCPAAVADVREAAARAGALTRQLLAFSRRDVVRARRLDLNELLADSRRLLARLVREDVEIEVLPAAAPAMVEADPAQLEQVVLNLVVNARDAIPGAGRVTVALSHRRDGGADPVPPGAWLLLSVTDDGVGMDARTLASVFEPFFTTKGPGRGTGLGLATVYSIVKGLGGHVFAQSEPGRGAEFRVWLPRAADAGDPRAARPTAAPPPGRHRGARGTVLLVEDEPAVRRMARRALAGDGWEVLEAEDGGAALDVARAHAARLTVVVTDVVMPRLRGPALVAQLGAELRRTPPVVYMSGYAEADGDRSELSQGYFVQKPFRPGELVAVVAAAAAAARPGPDGCA